MSDYIRRTMTPMGIDPDNGQGLARTDACVRFSCQKWEKNQPVAPRLVKDRNGFDTCPCCQASYGSQR